MEVTIKLLENAMRAWLEKASGTGWEEGQGRFLIDGFPRKMDQALKFEEDVGFFSFLVFASLICISRFAYRLSLFSLRPRKKLCSTVCWNAGKLAAVKMTMLKVSRSVFVCTCSVFLRRVAQSLSRNLHEGHDARHRTLCRTEQGHGGMMKSVVPFVIRLIILFRLIVPLLLTRFT